MWEVRAFLQQNGFRIEHESVLEDAQKLYITIGAFYDGIIRPADSGFCYFGTLLSQNDPLTFAYTDNLHRQLCIRLQALQTARIENEETEWLQACLAFYDKTNMNE